MTTLAPYSWLRQIPKELKKLDEPTPFGHLPVFDEAKFLQTLAQIFNLEDLKLELKPLDLIEDVKKGFEASEAFFFKLAPLQGEIAILIQKGDFERLLSDFAEKDLHQHILDEEFKHAFSHFVLLETSLAFQKAYADSSLSLQLLAEGKLPETGTWVKDVLLSWKTGSLSLRLVLSNSLRKSLKSKYALKAPTSKLFSEIHLNVHIEAGRVSLPRSDWVKLEVGDYLILDSCHLQPGQDKGRVILTVNHKPVFRARIKDGKIKILEYPLFYEVGATMTTPPDDEELHDEELDTELEGEEEYIEDEEEEIEPESPQATLTQEKPLKVEDIPLEIVVEAGRFQMTVQKISELVPGSLIDLDIHPEQGVDLVINGICVAKGELLKVGDTLGVRILDIAK